MSALLSDPVVEGTAAGSGKGRGEEAIITCRLVTSKPLSLFFHTKKLKSYILSHVEGIGAQNEAS